MDEFDVPVYVAILRTRAAELKGFRYLDAETRQSLLPVMEFTRSRRGKSNPTGAVAVCVEQVLEALNGDYFIADVSTLAHSNRQRPKHCWTLAINFQNWRRFVSGLGSACIPIVHLTDPFDAGSVYAQAIALNESCGMIAVRIPPDYEHAALLEQILTNALGSMRHVIVICDAGFVDRNSYATKAMAAFRTLFQFGLDHSLASWHPAVFRRAWSFPTTGAMPTASFRYLKSLCRSGSNNKKD